MTRVPLFATLLFVLPLPAGAAGRAVVTASNVTWSFPDSISACPAGDSVAAGHPSRIRIEVTYLQFTAGLPVPRVGAPPESVWVEWTTGSGDVRVNDQPGRAFADDSTDALGRTRVTLPSLSGCGTLTLTLRVAGIDEGSAVVAVRSTDSDLDGATTSADVACDLDYDGVLGPADDSLRARHLSHSHRNALFGTLVRRTNLCENCADEAPGTLGESSVSWSPDGRRLAFTIHLPPAGDCSVFLARSDPAEGDELIQFTFPPTGVHDYDPCWSPLGTEIVFGRGDNTLWMKGVPGLVADTTLRLISQHNDGTSRERGDVTPAFSPDGLWIAFARKTAEPTHWEIWKTPASGDTTQRVQLVFEDTGDDFYPQWSTDGQWIVYARISEGVESVWRVPAAGGTPEPVLSAGGGLMASTPAFSPDGAVILAGVGDPLAAVTHTLDARLTGLTLPSDFAVPSYPEYSVESGFPVLSPRSSPDGTRLALAAHQIYAARRNMSLPPRFDSVAGMGIAPATPFVVLEASEGSPLTFTVAASDPEGDPLDYRAFFLHDGMVFDPGTRTFSWTPPLGTLGTISSVRFQVATPSGGSAYAIARIAVTDLAAVGGPGAARVVALDPVRPNPVTAAATLRFALASAGRARVEVFDLNGRRVATALDESVSAGPHELNVATHAWRPGIYLCRLEAGGVTRVRRMAVVR